MKIKHLELQNFKFHQELNFDIENTNCLIYGENGTGKSSIYWSLVSVFKKSLVDVGDFKNRDTTDKSKPKVIITLDDDNELNLETDNDIIENINKTIFLAHQDMLEEFVGSNNFFDALNNKIRRHFSNIDDFCSKLETINSATDEINHIEQTKSRVELTKKYEEFLDKVLIQTNDIINKHFKESFQISLDYSWGELDLVNDYDYDSPIITLKIENQSNLKVHFNEAKLKLVSIALFFALIKSEKNENNVFKLLVLDDFLTSLDMANRKLIIQYILDNFADYQKIILTHNVQFYNLIHKMLNYREENKSWDIKNIFLFRENIDQEISLIKGNKVSYLYRAKKELANGDFHISSHYLRKEFERIINEFKQLLEIGKMEKLQNIIDTLKSSDSIFFIKPHDFLNKIIKNISNLLNMLNSTSINDNVKILKAKKLLETINKMIDKKQCNLSGIQDTLTKVEFDKNISFNPSSHDNEENEIYCKECLSSIGLIEELRETLEKIKQK